MDDTPHHLSHDTSATPPPLAADDFNPSHYYVVQISEYDAMKTKIERLRAEIEAACDALGDAVVQLVQLVRTDDENLWVAYEWLEANRG